LMAAFRGARGDLREALASSQRTLSGGGHRIRSTLVVAQVALTTILLVGAGLVGRSFVRLLDVDPGFRRERAVVLDVSVPIDARDPAEVARRTRFYDDLIARLGTLPGVRAAGGVNALPLTGGQTSNGTFIEMSSPTERFSMELIPQIMKDPTRAGHAEFRIASEGYFEAMKIPLVRGRLFDGRDAPDGQHVALVSASLARKEWPDANPIGKVIQFGNMDGDLRPFVVIGVVGDVREVSLASEPRPTFYAYYRQRPRAAQAFNVVVQGEVTPATVGAAARQIVRQLRPDVPPRLRTIETVIATSVADRRFMLVLLGAFGATALLLATLGVYSVIAYVVAQRKQEIGIRVALGARSADVLAMVLRQGAALALAGVGLGTLGALALTGTLQRFLYGVTTTDPVAFGGVLVGLTVVALLASLVPARRASKVEPMSVLRGS
ncbi:MAG TPA: FtsX-like permease family protein, partial [Gemmatimonadaceae bacterium]|nr:FtsX-like permease family protein [Gemmatimonadaceae bacterium]